MRKQIRRKLWVWMLLAALCISQIQSVSGAAAKVGKPSVTVSKRTKKAATIKIKKTGKVTGYQVYIAGSKGGKYKQTGATRTSTFQIMNLKSTKTYYVKVRAYRTSGNRIITGSFSGAVKIGKYVKQSAAEKYAKQIQDLVNEEREKAGQEELELSSRLTEAACVRAKELATKYSHIRPDGRDCFTVLTDKDIVYSSVGENIAAGQTSPNQVMKDWMNSEEHRENILSSAYTAMGVGYYKDPDTHQAYWVQIFARE